MGKDRIRIKNNKKYLIVSVSVVLLLVVAHIIRLTPLIQNTEVNWLTTLIVKNTLTLLVVAGLAFWIYTVEKKIFIRNLEKSEEGDEVL